MGYQNYTFPLAIYGSLDTFSRKIIFLKVWMSNSDPLLIAKFYVEYLLESNTELPTGVPEHMFSFPEKYGAENKHISITHDSLIEVGSFAGLEDAPSHYISEDELDSFNAVLPNPHYLECKDLANAFIFVKSNHPNSASL